MFTINKIFFDSSILIEAFKGKHKDFYFWLLQNFAPCVNETVCSEYWYHLLALCGDRSPLALKETDTINKVMEENFSYFTELSKHDFLPSNKEIIALAPLLMQRYNMLSNDALILATCLIHKIPKLASHDKDFILPCEKENLQLVNPGNYSAYTV